MAQGDSSFDIDINTKRNGAEVAAETQDVKQLTAATTEAAAAAEKLTIGQKNLASDFVKTTAAVKELNNASRPEDFAAAEEKWAKQLEVQKALIAINEKLAAARTAASLAQQEATMTAAVAAAAEEKLAASQAEQAAAAAEAAAMEEELAAAQIEQAAAAETATINTRGLSGAMTQLGSVIGGLRGLGRSFLNPMVVAIIVVIELYRKAKEALKEWNAELDKQAEINAKASWLPGIEARTHALLQARLEAEKFADALAHADDPVEKLAKGYDDLLKVSKQNRSESSSLSEAQMKYEEAVLEQSYKRKLISKATYEAGMYQIELEYRRRRRQLADEDDKAEESILTAKLAAIQKKQKELAPQVKAQEKVSDDATTKAVMDEAAQKQADDPDALKRAQEREAAVENKIIDAGYSGGDDFKKHQDRMIKMYGADDTDVKNNAPLVDEWDAAHGAVEQIYKARKQYAKSVPEDKSIAQKQKEELDRLRKQEEEANKKVEQLTEQLGEKKAADARAKVSRAEIEKVENATSAVKTGQPTAAPDTRNFGENDAKIKAELEKARIQNDLLIQAVINGLSTSSKAYKEGWERVQKQIAQCQQDILHAKLP